MDNDVPVQEPPVSNPPQLPKGFTAESSEPALPRGFVPEKKDITSSAASSGFTPVMPRKINSTPTPTFNTSQDESTKANSWKNLGTFVPQTVIGGLDKDAGQSIRFLGSKLGMSSNNPATRLGAKLEGWGKEHEQQAQEHALPNTTGGTVASTAIGFVPDAIELALTPELDVAKVGKLGDVLTKYGGKYAPKIANAVAGKFPIQQGAKGLVSGYSDAKDKGMSDSDATAESLKNAVKEYGKGVLFEGAGKAAEKASDLGKKLLEKNGLMANNALVSGAEKTLLHSTAQATAFAAVTFVTNALQGKTTSLDELKNNAIFGGVLGLFHGEHPKDEPTPADGSAKEVLDRSPLIDLNIFMSADMDAIKEAHTSEATPHDLQLKAASHAESAFKSDNDQEKQDQIVQSSLNGKLSGVKAITQSILKDKDGLSDAVKELPLSDETKTQVLAKIDAVHKELDPVEQQKTAIGNQIQQIDERLTQQPKTPVEAAENEVLQSKRDELNKQLVSIIKNQQNEKVNEQSGVAERPANSSESEEKSGKNQEGNAEHNREETRNEEESRDVNSGGEEPPLKQQENATKKISETEEGGAKLQDGNESGKTEEAGDSNRSVDETEGKEVKKTILTQRAYEGEIQDEVKKHLEDKGLTRSSFSQTERSKQATDIIKKFGDDGAYYAVKSGDVDGALAASTLSQLQIKNSQAIEDAKTSEERDELAKKQADYISLMEKKGYLGGEFNGQLAHEYQNQELNYANIKRQIEKNTGERATEEQDAQIKKYVKQIESLKKESDDNEAKLIEETDKAFNAGKEEAKNETKHQKAKRIADKVRAAKVHRPGIFSSASPASLAWDAAVEITAKSIEAGGSIADAIDAGIKHIRSTEWYKLLSDNKKQSAEKEFKQHHYDSGRGSTLEDLQERFEGKKDNKFTPNQASDIWKYMRETYIDNGTSYRDAISKTSEDLGLTWRQISEAIITPKIKRTSDEMWKKQADLARNRHVVKSWVADQNKNEALKAITKISGLFRGVAVFGHGGIFVGTHAGMTLFEPKTMSKTIKAFLNGWKFAYGNEANYEKMMEELTHSPNYVIAQRAGLNNNPERMNAEEYQKSQKYLGKLGIAGERGFNAIKILRQDLFDHYYNQLSPAEHDDPNVAKSIAYLMNNATGATNVKLPSWVNEVTFAGGMEAARWGKLLKNPTKAASVALKAITNPESASASDKVFAKIWAKRVGTELAVYTGALIANSALQNQLKPDNHVNLTHVGASDFGKFKFGDFDIDPTSGMRGTASFMYGLGKIPFSNKARGEDRLATASKKVGGYTRGKLSPLYSTVADFVSSQDFNANVMPYSHDKPGANKHKLSWTEYGSSKLPLPVAETFNTIFESAQQHGVHNPTFNDIFKGLITGAISGTTGMRVSEHKKKNTYSIKN